MKQPSMVASVLLGLILVVPEARAGGTAAGGGKIYKSPQEVFDTFKTSLTKEDWKGLLKCLTPESEKAFAGRWAFTIELIKGLLLALAKDEPDKVKGAFQSIDAVYKKHHLGKGAVKEVDAKHYWGAGGKQAVMKVFAKVGGRIKDRTGFITDLMNALSAMGSATKDFQFEGNPQLKDLKVSGDTATGTIVHTKKGKEQQDPIAFKKIRGSWKLELPEAIFKQGGPGGDPAPLRPPEARHLAPLVLTARLAVAPARPRR